MASQSSRVHSIQFLLLEGMMATSATLPSEMLHAAQSVADGRRRGEHELNIRTVALSRARVQTRAGFPLSPDRTLARAGRADIIYVPALWRNPKPIIRKHEAVLDWLREAYENGTTIAGVGTGCCFMAEAGLLDGRPATTHWHYFDRFERNYPRVHLKRDYFITQADELYCAASVNSLADLTVYFIRRLYGESIAHHVERHFSHEIRRAYESMRYFEGSSDKHRDETVLQIQLWLQDNYQQEVKFGDLAERFDMSVRSLNRRFKLATDKSPLSYLQDIRMGVARDLLKTSNLSISEIAYSVGYQDLGHFSALFKKSFSATPHDYRTTVRAKLFSIG
ncbi:GlxA family transcriptional regulator [Gilvimarinus sp. F26214L]|uniref:GlxA family transcriptional regulator n=1 Tax=Gilvimarinus sp. DZF01 TaxID=3461371 RepID=UPI004045C6CD